jgi:hypothetical protein
MPKKRSQKYPTKYPGSGVKKAGPRGYFSKYIGAALKKLKPPRSKLKG